MIIKLKFSKQTLVAAATRMIENLMRYKPAKLLSKLKMMYKLVPEKLQTLMPTLMLILAK